MCNGTASAAAANAASTVLRRFRPPSDALQRIRLTVLADRPLYHPDRRVVNGNRPDTLA